VQPGFSRIDECGVDVTLCEPPQDRSGDELGAIVAPDVSGCSMHADKPREYFDDTSRTNAAGYIDGQALARILVDDRQTLQLLAIPAGIEHKVVGPQVSCTSCLQWPRPTSSDPPPRAFSRHLQATLAP